VRCVAGLLAVKISEELFLCMVDELLQEQLFRVHSAILSIFLGGNKEWVVPALGIL
jgi:hypothetical protein